ncbi:hypothetical protein F4806DRAFT_469907 [Annulohypoxylon nitens]|nr:hypothetical protein F4806DRAFT_469907 [Annulohypoxylon nitens]
MAPNEMPHQQHLGLKQIFPAEGAADNTTIDIIAIHGLDTESPRTWEFDKRDGSQVVNWLKDDDMLPAAIPNARIYTYDWDAKVFDKAPVQTLLSHADNLLARVAGEHGPDRRPIIFVASCFGGLILAEAMKHAAQESNSYRRVLLETAGIVFLATPFRGSDAASAAKWCVVVGGIMGKRTSEQLVEDLDRKDKELRSLRQYFAELTHNIRLPIHHFYETKETDISRKLLPPSIANRISSILNKKTKLLLVTEDSACLDGPERQGLNEAHSTMNKFNGPQSASYKLVVNAIKQLAENSSSVIKRRSVIQDRHFIVSFGRNTNFVGREPILQQLLEQIPPGANRDDCQRTALEGLGGVGKTQVALEAAYQVRDQYPDCSVFWVPAVDAARFENAYRDIGRHLEVKGIEDNQADVKTLVKAALSRESAGEWLLIVDNADDLELLFGNVALLDYLPFSRKGSILFTTRNHGTTVRLDIPQEYSTTITEMNDDEAKELLRIGLKESQMRDAESTRCLLDFLANLPLAIKQASAYMASNTNVTTSQYLDFCQSSHTDMIDLLSRNFEDRYRYKHLAKRQNPIATTWLISFQHISQHNPPAAVYLKSMSLLAEKDIPLSLLPKASKLQIAEAIGTLKSYAFIVKRSDHDSFDMHRLVRLAMRNWLQTNGEWHERATNVLQCVKEEYPWPKHENRSIWTKYLPHAQAVLELEEISGDKEATAYLLLNAAESYYKLGKYNEAERLYLQTLDLRKQVSGKEHPSILNSMNNLGNVFYDQGKYEEAKQIYLQTLDLRKQALGKEHPHTLDSIHSLGSVFYEQGKYEEAEQIHRQTLDLRKQALGKEHPHTLYSMSSLGNVFYEQGKYEEAEHIHRQTLDLRKQILGKEHPDTLNSMNNVGNIVYNQGKYEEAGQIYKRTLDLKERVLGKEHPSTLRTKRNLDICLEARRNGRSE